jgi:hypothetical protein
MTRLTRSARGLLVAIAALALTGGAVLAARSLPLVATPGTQHAGDVSGRTVPANEAAGARGTNETPDADETPEPQDTPEAKDSAEADDATSNADRPHNHGWEVSQAANGDTPDGFDNHGDYVSSIARSDAGKPDAAATGADKSAAGKARAAAAKAAHPH